jgi:hypothetical protein
MSAGRGAQAEPESGRRQAQAMTDGPDGAGDDRHCGAEKRNGGTCKRPKGWGTSHPGVGRCKLHGGSTPTHERAAEVELARQECTTLGIPIETHPIEALIHEVWEAAGNVAFYRQLVRELPTHPEPDAFVEDDSENGGHWERGEPGVYGRTYHVSGIPTGEAKPHVLVVLYNDERKRLREASDSALRANVDERRVRIAEADAERITAAQMRALTAMGLGDRMEEFRGCFHRELVAEPEPAHLGATSAGRLG